MFSLPRFSTLEGADCLEMDNHASLYSEFMQDSKKGKFRPTYISYEYPKLKLDGPNRIKKHHRLGFEKRYLCPTTQLLAYIRYHRLCEISRSDRVHDSYLYAQLARW